MVLFIGVVMRNPPYLACVVEARKCDVNIVASWSPDLSLYARVSPSSAASLSSALSGGESAVCLSPINAAPITVAADEIQAIAVQANQDVFSKSDLIQSLKLSLKNWRVWALFWLQFSTFGAGVSSLSIWGPTFFRLSFGTTNQIAAIITFCFGICCSLRVFFGPIFDRISLLNSRLLGFFSSLLQGELLLLLYLFSHVFSCSGLLVFAMAFV